MARPYKWLPQVPKAIKKVAGANQSHYERSDLQDLFHVGFRTASSLIGLMDTVTIGTKVFVTRECLLAFLQSFAGDADPALHLSEHKTRTQQRKEESRQREVQAQKIKVARNLATRQKINWVKVHALMTGSGHADTGADERPENIEFQKGAITLRFRYLTDVMEGLGWLAGYVGSLDGEKFLDDLCLPENDPDSPEESEAKRLERLDAERIDFFTKNGAWPQGE